MVLSDFFSTIMGMLLIYSYVRQRPQREPSSTPTQTYAYQTRFINFRRCQVISPSCWVGGSDLDLNETKQQSAVLCGVMCQTYSYS